MLRPRIEKADNFVLLNQRVPAAAAGIFRYFTSGRTLSGSRNLNEPSKQVRSMELEMFDLVPVTAVLLIVAAACLDALFEFRAWKRTLQAARAEYQQRIQRGVKYRSIAESGDFQDVSAAALLPSDAQGGESGT